MEKEKTDQDEILYDLKYASGDRIFRVYDAMRIGIPLKENSQYNQNRLLVFKSN